MKSAFTFDAVCISPDKQIGLHSYNNWELSYVMTGSGSRTIGEYTERFHTGEIILIPPNIPHVWIFDSDDTDAEGNIANISVYFDTSTLESMGVIIPEISVALNSIAQLDHAISYKGEKLNAIQRILCRMRGMTPERRVPLMMELLIEISDVADSVYAGRRNTLSRTELRLESIRVYCACNYGRQITLEEISRHVGMNKSAFCTFLRKNVKMSFSEYINNMRLERAKVMLCNTDHSIVEIASDCGFQSITYFYRLFKRRYNISPRKFRIAETD